MDRLWSYLYSTIGRKQVMGVTGLGLSLFVFGHMAGNLLIFVGPEAYNKYGYGITSNPLIYIIESGLIVLFFTHIFLAVILTRLNKKAKIKYQAQPSGDKATPFVKKTMLAQGMIILVFVVLHLITFKFGPHYTVIYNGVEMRDLYRLLFEVFQSPIYTFGYVACMFVLGMHLSHGFYSALQTLGLTHPKGQSLAQKIGVIFGAVVAGGFLLQPLYVFLSQRG